jgi:hypothetical protein
MHVLHRRISVCGVDLSNRPDTASDQYRFMRCRWEREVETGYGRSGGTAYGEEDFTNMR